ncbi:unnamed protein product [Ectocarpus sp. 12 AP-2014]
MAEGLVDFGAGWVSGAVSIALTQPLDSVLVRVQAGTAAGSSSLAAAIRDLLSSGGGARSLWKGATPMMWSVPAQNALLFAGYGAGLGWCSQGERQQDGDPSSLWHVFAGGCAGGFAQSFVMSPVELVKVRLQLQDRAVLSAAAAGTGSGGGGAFALATGVVRTFGLSGLLSTGLGATMGRDVLPHGVWFASYEWCKQEFSAREGVKACDNGALSVGAQLASGGIAATTAWLVGYPFDVIKTRIQAAGMRKVPDGVVATARHMASVDGMGVFYRGFGLKLARAVPMSMIGFFAYEVAAKRLRDMIATS